MVLVFSAATNASPHVTRELEAAVGAKTPIVPVRLEPVEPSRDLRYFIGTSQWLDTGGVAADQWEPPLVRAVRRAVGQAAIRPPPAPAPVTGVQQPEPDSATQPGRGRWRWVAAAAALVAAAVVLVVLLTRPDDADDPTPDAEPDPVPEGRAGMATVFPSLTDDCDSVEPALDTKREVYLCRTDDYLVRYSRWDDGYDRAGFLDSFTGVAATPWTVDGEDAGKQWTYESADDPHPYRWTATYADLPFSVDVEAVSAKDRGLGIAAVEPWRPARAATGERAGGVGLRGRAVGVGVGGLVGLPHRPARRRRRRAAAVRPTERVRFGARRGHARRLDVAHLGVPRQGSRLRAAGQVRRTPARGRRRR